jgi:hypothetical protein
METLMNKLHKTITEAWNIGNKLHQTRINKWLENFTGDALITEVDSSVIAKKLEQQIALFLLCNFVYYNENEIKYLAKKMFGNFSHNILTSQNKKIITEKDFDEILRDTLFTYLGDVSESSSYLLYLFRQENDIVKTYFRERPNVKNIVYLDDFSLTGTQARDYLIGTKSKDYSDSKIAQYTNGERIYVLLMIATDEAVQLLSTIPNVTVIPCITLDSKSKAFSDDSIVFEGYEENYKEYAKMMCEFYGVNLVNRKESSPIGFGGSGYLFGAYYNIPDNTLPIFWSSKNGWSYLFKRYDKKYKSNGLSYGGRYV